MQEAERKKSKMNIGRVKVRVGGNIKTGTRLRSKYKMEEIKEGNKEREGEG